MSTAHTKKKSIEKIKFEIAAYSTVIVLLLLSIFNLSKHFSYKSVVRQPVLGAQTQFSEEEFWTEFLSENKHYIPGWVAIGRLDKATEIDPNYFLR